MMEPLGATLVPLSAGRAQAGSLGRLSTGRRLIGDGPGSHIAYVCYRTDAAERVVIMSLPRSHPLLRSDRVLCT